MEGRSGGIFILWRMAGKAGDGRGGCGYGWTFDAAAFLCLPPPSLKAENRRRGSRSYLCTCLLHSGFSNTPLVLYPGLTVESGEERRKALGKPSLILQGGVNASVMINFSFFHHTIGDPVDILLKFRGGLGQLNSLLSHSIQFHSIESAAFFFLFPFLSPPPSVMVE